MLANLVVAVLAVIVVFLVRRKRQSRSTGVKCEGTIVALESRPNQRGTNVYYPVLEYTPPGGRKTKAYLSGTNPPLYRIGEKVDFFHTPEAEKRRPGGRGEEMGASTRYELQTAALCVAVGVLVMFIAMQVHP